MKYTTPNIDIHASDTFKKLNTITSPTKLHCYFEN